MPDWIKNPLRQIRNRLHTFFITIYFYGNKRFCPVCGKSSRIFKTAGTTPRQDARCIHCGALERHRFVWLYFLKKTNLFDSIPKKILHVAPEPCFEHKLKDSFGENYITADLQNPHAMVRMDITDIQYPDQYFDVIYCSHVLEHVQDDRKAMREFHRVLKNDGWAILLVPITRDVTYEDPLITEPEARFKAFGQDDHVRRYGFDYVDRLKDAGFEVIISKVNDLFNTKDAIRMGLTPAAGEIYYCTKQCASS